MVKNWSVVEFICDACGEVWFKNFLGNGDFDACVRSARGDGWKIDLEDGRVFCPQCMAEGKEPLFNIPRLQIQETEEKEETGIQIGKIA